MSRAVARAARMSRLGRGSSAPGVVAEAISPGLAQRLSERLPDGVAVVTGTNGKTTTASMLRWILRDAGLEPAGNDTGANLRQGVVTSLVQAHEDARVAVLEVDEATLAPMMPILRPRTVVLTNVFRDQLDRYGETEHVARLLRRAAVLADPGAAIIVNADDPLLSQSLHDLAPITFGVRADGEIERPQYAEPEVCLACGGPLRYVERTIVHLGSTRCDRCGWASPIPDRTARIVSRDGCRSQGLEIDGATVTLQTGGVHNAYNAVAAVTAAGALGVAERDAVRSLGSFRPRFGRGEQLLIDGRPVLLTLMKNPGSAEALIAELEGDPNVGAVVVAVSDALADGRDISWIWDVDIERLATRYPLVASGSRSRDVAVRLRYAGSRTSHTSTDPVSAVRTALNLCAPPAAAVVLATYTAMLDTRRALLGGSGHLQDVPA